MSDITHVPQAFIDECRSMGFSDSMILAMMPKPKASKDAKRKAFYAANSTAPATKDPVKCTVHRVCQTCGGKETGTLTCIIKSSDPVEWDVPVSVCSKCHDYLDGLDKETLIKTILMNNSSFHNTASLTFRTIVNAAKKTSIDDIITPEQLVRKEREPELYRCHKCGHIGTDEELAMDETKSFMICKGGCK